MSTAFFRPHGIFPKIHSLHNRPFSAPPLDNIHGPKHQPGHRDGNINRSSQINKVLHYSASHFSAPALIASFAAFSPFQTSAQTVIALESIFTDNSGIVRHDVELIRHNTPAPGGYHVFNFQHNFLPPKKLFMFNKKSEWNGAFLRKTP